MSRPMQSLLPDSLSRAAPSHLTVIECYQGMAGIVEINILVKQAVAVVTKSLIDEKLCYPSGLWRLV